MLKILKHFADNDLIAKSLDHAIFEALNKLCGFNPLQLEGIVNGNVLLLSGSSNFVYETGSVVYIHFYDINLTTPLTITNWTPNSIEGVIENASDINKILSISDTTCYDFTNSGNPYQNTPFLQYFYSNMFVEYASGSFLDRLGEMYSTLRYNFDDYLYRNIIKNYVLVDKSIFNSIENFLDFYLYRNRKHTKLTEAPIKRRIPIVWNSADRIIDDSKKENFLVLWDLYGSFLFDSGSDYSYLQDSGSVMFERFRYNFSYATDSNYYNTRFDSGRYVWDVIFNKENIYSPTDIPLVVVSNDTEINENTLNKTPYRNLFNLNSAFAVINIYLNSGSYPPVSTLRKTDISGSDLLTWAYTRAPGQSLPDGFIIEKYVPSGSFPDIKNPADWIYLGSEWSSGSNTTYTVNRNGIPRIAYRVYPSGTLPTLNKGILLW